jgi:hypothetical protein
MAALNNHCLWPLALCSAIDQSLLQVIVCEKARIAPVKYGDNSNGVTASDSMLTLAELIKMQADADRPVDTPAAWY